LEEGVETQEGWVHGKRICREEHFSEVFVSSAIHPTSAFLYNINEASIGSPLCQKATIPNAIDMYGLSVG